MICSLHAHRKGLLTVSILINAVPVRGPRVRQADLSVRKQKSRKVLGTDDRIAAYTVTRIKRMILPLEALEAYALVYLAVGLFLPVSWRSRSAAGSVLDENAARSIPRWLPSSGPIRSLQTLSPED